MRKALTAIILAATLTCAAPAFYATFTVTLSGARLSAFQANATAAGQTVDAYVQSRIDELADSYIKNQEARQDAANAEKEKRIAAEKAAQIDAIRKKARSDIQSVLDSEPDPQGPVRVRP